MKKLSLLTLAVLATSAFADEGQWQPHQLADLQAEFTRVGIELPAKQVAQLDQYPLNAVVGLGYCSASFVSPKGLVVTNHHCAYGAIQNNSTAQKNLITEGFLAKNFEQELPAGPQERLYITEQVTDVTDNVIGTLSADLTGKARYDAIENNRKQLIGECESDANYRCVVRSFHHGMEYFMIKQLMIKDVRLVYAPSEAIGNYGGDIDNYEYPRHTGDFSFVRAYVNKEGKPAEYSKDNVPYQPKSWLKVSGSGVKQGDGIILAGYPGSTSRYRLTDEIVYANDVAYPLEVETYNLFIDTVERATENNPEAAVKYASRVKSTNNRLKKRLGLLDGFKVTDIAAIKAEQEAQLLAWMKADISRAEYLASYDQLKSLLLKMQGTQSQDLLYSYAQNSDLLGAASRLYRLAKESEKPNAARKIGYQERDLKMIESGLKRTQTKFDSDVDAKVWQAFLALYLTQSEQSRISAFDAALGLNPSMDEAALAALIKPYYADTALNTIDGRLAWMGKSVAEFEQSNDPFIKLAVALYQTNLKREEESDELSGLLAQARPQFMKSIIAYNREQGRPVYPDANGTLRVTYGSVDGYPAADGVYKTPFTSVRGLIAKNTNTVPFNAPANLVAAYNNKQYGDFYYQTLDATPEQGWLCSLVGCEQPKVSEFNSIPVNFLSSADTTGGNSGSPVMNGRGELVGLNFDSTYESITKDWYFNAKITRAIHVDIRYILWLMSEVDNAENLLAEMDVVK
ncbi:S46 family peptidase [Pseudoalteromonas tunicata]|uniref:S46 family peptidase n=1 Tax=Pseudoalteromonas tunicata TaxID=314281 RepID=UPI00273EEE8A|nr:S46 family peptidase [Pseudoalteromonas tunicata]MDP4983194.1 S46 family peptidase [Pseudoalteromonas tunicata]MDP5211806.1 S46 family peptidase [Pseudoalteromonas tunicata]